MNVNEIEAYLRDYVQDMIASAGINVGIDDVFVTGSRARGYEASNSDLDVIVSYTGSFPEDSMFNLLNDKDVVIGGVKVDFNPLSLDKRVSLADYLISAEKYMDEHKDKMPLVTERIAGYGLPNKATEDKKGIHIQDLRRTGHVRR